MKDYKLLTVILIVVNVILIGVCTFFYVKKDRVAPKFEFEENSAIYNAGIGRDTLMQGIRAYDGVDGDVTDRIVIEKIVENPEVNTAVVYYAVSDATGNVSKISREFRAVYPSEAVVTEVAEEVNATVEGDDKAVEEIEEDNTEEESQETTVEEAEDEAEKPEDKPEEEKPAEEPAQQAPAVNPTAPVMILKQASTDVGIGQGIAWANIIKTMTDDKDGYEALFGNIVVSKFDRNKAGDYPVTVYTVDSDGNKSNVSQLLVHVK